MDQTKTDGGSGDGGRGEGGRDGGSDGSDKE